MEEDLGERGYIMEWCKVDAKEYLLPQRRNRIYAIGDVNSGQKREQFVNGMRSTMDSLKSDMTFSLEDIFEKNVLAPTKLTERARKQVGAALEQACLKGQTKHVFVDISTSQSRNPEYCVGATTCIRPAGGIYACSVDRCMVPAELWRCQGLWVDEFANPEAARNILQINSEAKDLCGNAFASTSCQAKLIASLVHCVGWRLVGDAVSGEAVVPCGPPAQAEDLCETEASVGFETTMPKKRKSNQESGPATVTGPDTILCAEKPASPRRKRKRGGSAEGPGGARRRLCLEAVSIDSGEAGAQPGNAEASSSAGPALPVLRRCRKKTAPAEAGSAPLLPQRPQRRPRQEAEKTKGEKPKRKYTEKPETVRSGKQPCVTIATKVRLFKEAWSMFLFVWVYNVIYIIYTSCWCI